MKNRRFTFRIIFFSLIGLIIILTVAGVFLSKLAHRKLQAGLDASGIKVRAYSINLLTRSISIEGFEWRVGASSDSVAPSLSDSARDATLLIDVTTIHATDIDVLAFLRKKEIHIGAVILSHGKLIQDRLISDKKQTDNNDSTAKKPLPFTQITIGRLTLDDISVVLKRGSLNEHMANVSMELHDIGLLQADRFQDIRAYELGEYTFTASNYRMAAQRSMYTLSVKQIKLDSREQNMTVDSIVLIPKYGKYQFSRRLGKQIDRFVLRIPGIALTGLDLSNLRDSAIVASSLKIHHADLHVFRDKRLPFIKHHNTPLPVALIRTLPFEFTLDTLLLDDTKILYEEFPENGFKTGYILFDQLRANAANLTNRTTDVKQKQSVLHVTSRVMQQGNIAVDFTLPYGKSQVYNATGKISNLRLDRLNPILESLAFVRVESGRLNALNFNFDYDDRASNGNILINYEDLKLAGLTKDKESKENDVKSLALGLFVRKDKDRDVPIEKRSGKIYYERDRRRAVFNIWVKSLFSGIKSSVVDPPSERKTLTRKERRDSLRDVRKENRAKKRKEKQEEQREAENETPDNSIRR